MATKKQRNNYGMGSLRWRSNGTFEYRIGYHDLDGVRKVKSFYGQSDVVCHQKANKFLEELEKEKRGITIHDTIPEILKRKCKQDYELNYVGEQGYSRNLYTISVIEKNYIGKIPLVDVTMPMLDMFLRTLTNYSNSLITKVYRYIRLAYDEAFNRGIIEKNTFEIANIRCPKSRKQKKKVTGLTRDEQSALWNILSNMIHRKEEMITRRSC